ncbi:NADP-dependent oxidoreductase domain-containing protein [Melanogaster broomeanus]|nr:NADP-dependent oxidoreductase domain-containing protein [Melanogaster broomeanus]
MPYPTRNIGKDNVPVSAIGFGAMGISAFYGDIDPDQDRFKVLDAALDNGCTFWDTANIYGDSEDLIGKWFKKTGKRDQVFLATKFGIRLGVPHVDLYYLHRPDPDVPIEETVEAMANLVKYTRQSQIPRSLRMQRRYPSSRKRDPSHRRLQVEYSPFTLDIEKNGVLETARELGTKIIAYSPLGRGLLTGRYKSPDDFDADDFRRVIPRYSSENFPKILGLAKELENVGKEYNATAGQVALAWLLAQGEDVIPIPGTKKIKYLEENLGAATITLSPETVQHVRKVAEEAVLAGDRYPDWGMKLLFADTPAYNK